MSSELKDPQFHKRLTEMIGSESPFSWATRIGISKGAFSRIWNEGTVPGPEHLRRIAMATGVSIDWMLTGDEPRLRREGLDSGVVKTADAEYSRRESDRYSYIPVYNVGASAGGGAVVDQELVVDSLAFKTTWIKQQLNASPKDLYLIHVEGESMEPTLRPGDVILVDHRAANTLPRDGIYVLRMDSTLLVKRLQRLPGGTIEVTSDNPAYKPFSINMGKPADDLAIIGRVVWCGRRM